MSYNKEEKEAIEQLKNWREYIVNHRDSVNKANDKEFYLRIALNLIDKQQKEIEELQNEVMEQDLMITGLKEDKRIAIEEIQIQYYVNKDKIKEKIEELQQEIKDEGVDYDWNKNSIISVLQELLQEGDK